MSKIMIIDTYYKKFNSKIQQSFSKNELDYEDLLSKILDLRFGTTGALAFSFDMKGWRAFPIIANSTMLQSRWSVENFQKPLRKIDSNLGSLFARVDLNLIPTSLKSLQNIVLEQAKKIKPDIILIQDLNLFSPNDLKWLRNYCSLLIGEIASPLPPNRFLVNYDLIFSALPSIVDHVNSLNVEAVFMPLGFDSRLSKEIISEERDIDLVFIGSAGKLWDTFGLLEKVKKYVPNLRIYGPLDFKKLKKRGLIENYFGEAWGIDMFKILSRSKISLNRHGGITGNFAGNMRMYESTGMGSLLLTEDSPFLPNLFDPSSELVTYKNYDDAGIKAASLLGDTSLLNSISAAGAKRTHDCHTYDKRVEKMIEIFSKTTRKS